MPFPMIVEGPVGWMGLEHAYVKQLVVDSYLWCIVGEYLLYLVGTYSR